MDSNTSLHMSNPDSPRHSAWWWSVLSGTVATIIGIGLTFGLQGWQSGRQQDRMTHDLLTSTLLDLTLTMVIYDDETAKADEFDKALCECYREYLTEGRDSVSAFKQFSNAMHRCYTLGAFNNPVGEYYKGNLETLNAVGDLQVMEFIQTCYSQKERYQNEAAELKSLISECMFQIDNYSQAHPGAALPDVRDYLMKETDLLMRMQVKTALLVTMANQAYSWTQAYMEQIMEMTGISQSEIDSARAARSVIVKSFLERKGEILKERRSKYEGY